MIICLYTQLRTVYIDVNVVEVHVLLSIGNKSKKNRFSKHIFCASFMNIYDVYHREKNNLSYDI